MGGRLRGEVEEVIYGVWRLTLASPPRQSLRVAYELLATRLAALGLERPSYSTFRRRVRLWSMHG